MQCPGCRLPPWKAMFLHSHMGAGLVEEGVGKWQGYREEGGCPGAHTLPPVVSLSLGA